MNLVPTKEYKEFNKEMLKQVQHDEEGIFLELNPISPFSER